MMLNIFSFVGIAPYKKWVFSGILLPVALYLILSRGTYTIFDHIDLIIHEAGHFFFILFGDFLYMAGGTLMQIIFPMFIAWYFFRNSYRIGVQIFIFWTGQNLINISIYASDANKLQLPLLGNGRHDWLYLLGKLDILQSADFVGYIFFLLSILILGFSLLLPLFYDA
jgi:hypothetical protein